MKKNTQEEQLRLFNVAVATEVNSNFTDVNKVAIKAGYIVHPNLCTIEVLAWLSKQTINVASTFYKEWTDITDKTRLELFIDQLKHYASTYGTNYDGPTWTASGNSAIALYYTDLNVISPVTIEEMTKLVHTMAYSGIAMKETTIADIIAIIQSLEITIDIELVKNRELKIHMYSILGIIPTSNDEMVRFLVYLCAGTTVVIKDAKTIESIKELKVNVRDNIMKYGVKKLSSIFFRHKRLFLAMRSCKSNRPVINKLRKLANETHVPYKPGYFETILSNPSGFNELEERLKTLPIFKKISLIQTIAVRKKELNFRSFLIRNGKVWNKVSTPPNKKYYTLLSDILYKSLIADLSAKACKVKLLKGANIVLPTSEKSFLGNIPFGSSFSFTGEDSIVGIYWKGEDGAQDLDLSAINTDGTKVGWNSHYNTNGFIYSGDMTSANPDACELLYCKKGAPSNSSLMVNSYNGELNSKFKFFVAISNIKLNRNVMVDPNDIKLSIDLEMTSNQMQLGVVADNKYIALPMRTGSSRVSEGMMPYTDYAVAIQDTYLNLESVLTEAGFDIVEKDEDLDLSLMNKSTLISLLS